MNVVSEGNLKVSRGVIKGFSRSIKGKWFAISMYAESLPWFSGFGEIIFA